MPEFIFEKGREGIPERHWALLKKGAFFVCIFMHGRVADREANPIISTFGGQHHAASPLVPISTILRVQSQVATSSFPTLFSPRAQMAIYFRLLLSLQSLAENHPLDFLQPNFLLSIRANCNQHGTISSLLGLLGDPWSIPWPRCKGMKDCM